MSKNKFKISALVVLIAFGVGAIFSWAKRDRLKLHESGEIVKEELNEFPENIHEQLKPLKPHSLLVWESGEGSIQIWSYLGIVDNGIVKYSKYKATGDSTYHYEDGQIIDIKNNKFYRNGKIENLSDSKNFVLKSNGINKGFIPTFQ